VQAALATAAEVGSGGEAYVDDIEDRMTEEAAGAVSLATLQGRQGELGSTKHPDWSREDPWGGPWTFKTGRTVQQATEAMRGLGLGQEDVGGAVEAAWVGDGEISQDALTRELAARVAAGSGDPETGEGGMGEATGKDVGLNRGDHGGAEGESRPNEEVGAIGEGVRPDETHLEQAAAAADGDIGDGNLGRLDFELAPAGDNQNLNLAELERRVVADLSRLNFTGGRSEGRSERGRNDSGPDTDAYLLTEMRGNYKQRDLLDEVVSKAPEEIQTAYRHGVIHLLTCTQIYWTDKWHPMHHEEVLIKQLPGGWSLDEITGGTSRLWDFEESVIQCFADGFSKSPDENGQGGLTRKYRIDPEFAIRFQQLAEDADANYKLHHEDGEAGKRARGSAALKTKFRDKSGNQWGREWTQEEKNDEDVPTLHYSLLDGALRVLSNTEHKIDITEITEMRDILEEEYEQAKDQYDHAVAEYEQLAYLPEEEGKAPTGCARTEQEMEEIREARSKMQAAERWREKAAGRYHSLLSGLSVITDQADRIEDGVAYIQNAYEIQEVSGRKTFRRGGPQGLPAVLKSFAYSMEDVYNYDIKSSQTTGLRQLAEDLRRVGYDVDTEALDTYIERGGKDWVTQNYDLPRSLVKRVEHAIKFGAGIPDSMESAYRLRFDDDNNFDMPEIAEHVEEYYTHREAQNRVLSDLNEVFGPQVQMIEDLAEGLITAYWDAHSQAGGRGKGRFMRNHAGITFCKHDHREPVYENGELVDYKYGHEAHSQAMAWYLQGLEAAYVDAITILSTEYDYEVMANEHDGCITTGRVPDRAKRRAREISGSRNAKLVPKRFEDEEDVRELCNKHGFNYPSPPFEETSTDPCKTQENPGDDEPQSKPASGNGSAPTTSRTPSSRPPRRKSSSNGATPAGDGPNATIPPSGDGRAGRAPVPPEQREHEQQQGSEDLDPHTPPTP
jgi:hypothetical protein